MRYVEKVDRQEHNIRKKLIFYVICIRSTKEKKKKKTQVTRYDLLIPWSPPRLPLKSKHRSVFMTFGPMTLIVDFTPVTSP